MQLEHTILTFETAVENQLRVAGPEVAEVGGHLMAALKPAIRQSLMDVANMAAEEVSSQLRGQKVEIRLVDGDPELAVVDDGSDVPPPPPPPDDDEARITVRLPSYLKDLVADAASDEGNSLNSFIVEALRGKAHPRKGGMTRHKTTIEL